MRIFLCFLLIICSLSVFSQDKWAIGPLYATNFAIKSTGVGFRATIPLTKKIILNPEVKYFLSINPIEEVFAGINVQYLLISSQKELSYSKSEHIRGKPSLYVTAGVDYNNWLNYDPTIPTLNTTATANNVLPNIGIGSAMGGPRIRLFAEARYNIIWNESFGEIGLLIYPMHFKKRNKSLSCPKVK
jgi:hypothetical protein